MACEEGCTIPVCLNFTHVNATDEFKIEMQELFAEIFADLCGNTTECCPGVEVIDGKIAMCTRQGNTVNVAVSACKGILNAGGTCGACTIEEEE